MVRSAVSLLYNRMVPEHRTCSTSTTSQQTVCDTVNDIKRQRIHSNFQIQTLLLHFFYCPERLNRWMTWKRLWIGPCPSIFQLRCVPPLSNGVECLLRQSATRRTKQGREKARKRQDKTTKTRTRTRLEIDEDKHTQTICSLKKSYCLRVLVFVNFQFVCAKKHTRRGPETDRQILTKTDRD